MADSKSTNKPNSSSVLFNDSGAAARDYHERTNHSWSSIRSNPHFLDWANQPYPFKRYRNINSILLPKDWKVTAKPALAAVADTGIDPADSVSIDATRLAAILHCSAGITKERVYPGGRLYFRAAACAGALYPIEVYIISGGVEGLASGVYHFNPADFSLEVLRQGNYLQTVLQISGGESAIAKADVVLALTAISWRSSWKYRDRAYRYHFWDAGMVLANALAASWANSVSAEMVMGFDDGELGRLLEIDGEKELPIALLPLGAGRAIESSSVNSEAEDFHLETVPLSHSEVDYPLIYKTHWASSLHGADQVREWRESTQRLKSILRENHPLEKEQTPRIALDLPPAGELPIEGLEHVIARRGSTRRFSNKPIAFAELSVILDRSTRGIPSDVDGALIDVYLIANNVEGLERGAYWYERASSSLETLKTGDFREKAAYLGLEQDLCGESGASFFLMSSLDPVLKELGSRGYRAAQTEAGIIGGKLYLTAYALGRGATGLTFFDKDVTDFFSPHASGKSCMLIIAAGVPGKRPLYG